MNNAGKLKFPISFYQKLVTQDPSGQPLEQYVLIVSVKAYIVPKTGRDFELAQQISSEITHDITIRWNGRIRATQQIHYGSRTFEIVAIIDPDETRNWMYIKAKEVAKR